MIASKVHHVTWSPARVVIDPNSSARHDHTLSVALLDDADRAIHTNETVWAVQPDDDGFEGVAIGRVVQINDEHRLVYIRVDWNSFKEQPITPDQPVVDVFFVSRDLVLDHHQKTPRLSFGASVHLRNGSYLPAPSIFSETVEPAPALRNVKALVVT